MPNKLSSMLKNTQNYLGIYLTIQYSIQLKSKIMAMYDYAAKFCNVSLNDKVVRGPELMKSLIGVLIQFRKEEIVLVDDVKQMFQQVRLNPGHKDSLRFL